MELLTAIIAGIFTLGAVYLKHWLETRASRVEPPASIPPRPAAMPPPDPVPILKDSRSRRSTRVVILGAWGLLAAALAAPTWAASAMFSAFVVGSGPAYLLFLEMRRAASNFPLLLVDVAIYIGVPYTVAMLFIAGFEHGEDFLPSAAGATFLAIGLYFIVFLFASICYFFKLARARL
jgi:hypothetical protein